MPTWSLIAKGAVGDATELVEELGHLLHKHGATDAALASAQFTGDPRDVAALDADPNAPVDPAPAVAAPDEVADDSDVSRETGDDPAETRDDLPAASDHDPGPVPDGA